MFNRIEQLQNEAFQNEPYSLGRKNKNEMLIRWLNIITKYHFENCIEYKNIIKNI